MTEPRSLGCRRDLFVRMVMVVGGRSLLLLCFGQLLLLLLHQQLGSVSLLFVTHPVVFSAEPVSAETALELPVPSVHHVMPLQVL